MVNCRLVRLTLFNTASVYCLRLMQVVWWSTLLEKFQPEIAGQPDVFGGEHGEQRQKDFR
jgi:hypothetical protein